MMHGGLEQARAVQQQVIEQVDDIEDDASRSMSGSHYQLSPAKSLSALQEPVIDNLPSALNELQESTYLMQDQQEKFLYHLPAAQNEIQHLRPA